MANKTSLLLAGPQLRWDRPRLPAIHRQSAFSNLISTLVLQAAPSIVSIYNL